MSKWDFTILTTKDIIYTFKFVLSVGNSMGKIEMMEKEKKASILETS